MPIDLGYPVYDADNHLYESEEAMTAHLPKKWRREFQYVQVGGRTKLAIGGKISDYIPNPTFDVLAAPGVHEMFMRGKNPEGLSMRELTGDVVPCMPGWRTGDERLKLLDEQGVHATLMFPTLASVVEERMRHDHELLNAVLHALNEWLHVHWGFAREGRIFAVPFISLMDLDMALTELEWALARGARTVALRPAPVPGYRGGRSPGAEEFDPFWARVNEAGIFVSLHASDSGYDSFNHMWQGGAEEFRPFEPDPFKSAMGNSGRAIRDTLAALICHGVFDRHPKVRVAAIENGSIWVREFLATLETTYGMMPQKFQQNPVEAFRKHIYVSPYYEDDIPALAEMIGVTNVVFGSDYPHPEGLADPTTYINDIADMSPADQQRIMSTNLKELIEGVSSL
jgi:predicted TIM-barrel fold metal-dependent hydrolase